MKMIKNKKKKDVMITWKKMKPCRSRRIITLEAAGGRFCNFFAGVPQNEDPIRPQYQITGQNIIYHLLCIKLQKKI